MVETSTKSTHNANAVPQNSHQIYSLQLLLLGWLVENKQKRMWKEVVMSNLRYYVSIFWRNCRKPQNRQSGLPISGLSFEPRTTQIWRTPDHNIWSYRSWLVLIIITMSTVGQLANKTKKYTSNFKFKLNMNMTI